MDPNNVAAQFQFEGGYTGKTNPVDGNNGGGGVHDGWGDVVTLKKGPWTAAEDAVLVDYVIRHGEGNWNAVRKTTGLARCGKSCRLRWANHLRPNLKKGAFSPEEEELIIKFHAQFGNKWAKMASLLPGRTDNEIKNYWNTRIKRRQRQGLPLCSQKPCHGYQNSSTTPTSLTAPTTSTGPAFQFQAQSHFSHSQTPHPYSPLTSSCPTTPTYSTLPLFNPASSSFQRPTPTFSPTLRFKRLRFSTGGYALSPSCSASQLDEPATTQLSNFERFQLPMILDTSSSSPILKTKIDSDRMTASATSVFPMKLELPSNQLSEAKEPEITSDTNLANGATTSQINHGQLFGDLWYESKALLPYNIHKENALFDEYRGMHEALRFNEEVPNMSKLMQGDFSKLLRTMPSSTQQITEWLNDGKYSNGQSSFLTTDHDNAFGLDMRPLNSLATLLSVASGNIYNGSMEPQQPHALWTICLWSLLKHCWLFVCELMPSRFHHHLKVYE